MSGDLTSGESSGDTPEFGLVQRKSTGDLHQVCHSLFFRLVGTVIDLSQDGGKELSQLRNQQLALAQESKNLRSVLLKRELADVSGTSDSDDSSKDADMSFVDKARASQARRKERVVRRAKEAKCVAAQARREAVKAQQETLNEKIQGLLILQKNQSQIKSGPRKRARSSELSKPAKSHSPAKKAKSKSKSAKKVEPSKASRGKEKKPTSKFSSPKKVVPKSPSTKKRKAKKPMETAKKSTTPSRRPRGQNSASPNAVSDEEGGTTWMPSQVY